MSQHILQDLQQSDLMEVKQKLFNSPISKQSQHNFTKKKIFLSPILSTPTKIIKLRSHLKTELIATTPRGVRQARMRTSPNTKSPLKRINEFKTAKFQANNQSTNKNKSIAQQINSPYQDKVSQNRLINQSLGQLYLSPNKPSLSYSQIYRESQTYNIASDSRQRQKLSKYQKKQMFTIFKSKEKSLERQKIENPHKLHYEIPYRYHSSITIDLLNSTITNNQKAQKNKSSKKSSSCNKKQYLTTKPKAIRCLIQPQDNRIFKSFKKIEKFKFVFEYMSHSEIINKLQAYAFLKQPQCKWPLLIVDQVFKRKRKQGEKSAF